MATEYRSPDREAGISFRMSRDERQRLELAAVEEGYASVQELLEARVFGAAKPRRRPGPQTQTERLDIGA